VLRVLIASDVRLYRDGIGRLVGGTAGFEVSGTCGAVAAVVDAVERQTPDVVLLDAGLPGAVAIARAIGALPARVIVMNLGDADVLAFAEAGVAGFVPREGSVTDLQAAIAAVARGRDAPPEPLTARERQIVDLIDAGLSNKEIAERLVIGVPTVKTHVHNILKKLGARRRGQAAARARVLA
jgi:DNA-binding NarL/FixJ family response regulator